MPRRNALPDPEVERGLRELEAALAHEPGADPDLATLVADVEAVRPEPDASFLAALDARVHAGFASERAAATPKRGGSWRARLRQSPLLLPGLGAAVAAGLIVVVVALPGSTTSGGGDSASSSSSSRPTTIAPLTGSGVRGGDPTIGSAPAAPGSGATSSADAAETAPSTSSSSQSAAKSAPLPAPTTAGPRKVERSAALTLTPAPADVQDTADGVVRETQAAGGYVQRSHVTTQDTRGTAEFTLRIPSAHLDDALQGLSKLAHVGGLTQASTDITATAASAADRLDDARAERRALLQALGRATTDRQIASLKARLADNRDEIAARQSALNSVRRRADLATVEVTVQGTGRPAAHGGGAWTPGDALHDAGRVLEVAGGVAVIALAVLGPLAILALLAWFAARTLRRRRRETALDRAA
ncbi:MAG TPA: DUF4349 domain-containing protein [Baekduia sp.]|jgi:hypothetical protein